MIDDKGPVAEVVAEALNTAAWQRTEQLYRQCGEIASSPAAGCVPEDLLGRLSAQLCGLVEGYRGDLTRFVQHGFAVFAQADGLAWLDAEACRAMCADPRFGATPEPAGRDPGRRPPPAAALLQTCRRLRDAQAIRTVLRGAAMSAFLGGSVSYGPFYNVRKISDLDILLVVEDIRRLPADLAVLRGVHGVEGASLDDLLRRAGAFVALSGPGNAIFSHKLGMWPVGTPDPMVPWARHSRYVTSLHCMPRAVLEHILFSRFTAIGREFGGEDPTVDDYREDPPDPQIIHRTLAGRDRFLPAVFTPVPDGVRHRCRVAHFDDTDCYSPGLVHSMLLTPQRPLWDELDLEQTLETFRWKVGERLAYEQRRGDGDLRVSHAHMRRHVLAPHMREAIDRRYA